MHRIDEDVALFSPGLKRQLQGVLSSLVFNWKKKLTNIIDAKHFSSVVEMELNTSSIALESAINYCRYLNYLI